MVTLKEIIVGKVLNINTDMYRHFEKSADTVMALADKKIKDFQHKYHTNQLTGMQQSSYIANGMKHQMEQQISRMKNLEINVVFYYWVLLIRRQGY